MASLGGLVSIRSIGMNPSRMTRLDSGRASWSYLTSPKSMESSSGITANRIGSFHSRLARGLTNENLSDLFALEVVHSAEGGGANECTADVEVDNLGTVVLLKSMVDAQEFLPTGWPGPLQPGDSEPPEGPKMGQDV